ncbi:MAG TPA: hypothetical protein VIR03_00340 [Candidatus Saccharimonadales bacterium]
MADALATSLPISELSKADEQDRTMRDFYLYITPSTSSEQLLDAIHALYYLPQNIKLVITDAAMVEDNSVVKWAMQNCIDRILFEDDQETQQHGASPFSYADAILANATSEFARVGVPLLVVADDADIEIAYNERHGYSVPAGNPEAMASAVMRLARARA